jgi:hypothetical protein
MAYIYRNPHRQALTAVEQELAERLEQIEMLKARVKELQEARKALLPLAQQESSDEMTASLPQLCLRILNFSGQATVAQIRDGLRIIGVEVKGQNPLAILHTTLGRLTQSGYAEAVPQHPGVPLQYRITTAGKLALQI